MAKAWCKGTFSCSDNLVHASDWYCLQCTRSTVLFIDNKMTLRNSISNNRSFTAILVIKEHFFPVRKQMLIPIIPIQGIENQLLVFRAGKLIWFEIR